MRQTRGADVSLGCRVKEAERRALGPVLAAKNERPTSLEGRAVEHARLCRRRQCPLRGKERSQGIHQGDGVTGLVEDRA